MLIAAGLTAGFTVYFTGRRQNTMRLNARSRTLLAVRQAFKLQESCDGERSIGRAPITGDVHGFPLRIDFSSSKPDPVDATADSSEMLNLQVALPDLYTGVSVRPETPYSRLRVDDVQTGDSVTDADLLIFGPELQIAAIMNTPRRGALRQAVGRGLIVEGGDLRGSLRVERTTAAEIIDLINQMVRFARRIDVAGALEEALADNALSEAIRPVRSRCQLLLLDRDRFGTNPTAQATAERLLAEPDDQARARAAQFLGRWDILYALAGGDGDAQVRTLALRGLSNLPPGTARRAAIHLAAALQDPPSDCDSAYFEQAAHALRAHCSDLLEEPIERIVLGAIEAHVEDAGRALVRLLRDRGSPLSVATLRALPRWLRSDARAAVASIQSRAGSAGGRLALAKDDAGALSLDEASGALQLTEGVWAVILAKAFVEAKSRLAPSLDHTERARLARMLLQRLLNELNHTTLAGVVVATRSHEVGDLALEYGAQVIADGDAQGVAEVVHQALDDLVAQGASAAVVLMADLPLLDRSDVTGLLDALRGNALVIAPDRHDGGANVVGVRLPPPFTLPFGRDDSFSAHVDAAEAHQVEMAVYRSLGASLDLDTGHDLTFWRQLRA